MENDADQDRPLAGAGGDDMSAGTSVSGIGGEVNRTENEEVGLGSVAEGAARLSWGKDAEEGPEQPVATHDGTGQSEKPADQPPA
jgi:hypothetical protein